MSEIHGHEDSSSADPTKGGTRCVYTYKEVQEDLCTKVIRTIDKPPEVDNNPSQPVNSVY